METNNITGIVTKFSSLEFAYILFGRVYNFGLYTNALGTYPIIYWIQYSREYDKDPTHWPVMNPENWRTRPE